MLHSKQLSFVSVALALLEVFIIFEQHGVDSGHQLVSALRGKVKSCFPLLQPLCAASYPITFKMVLGDHSMIQVHGADHARVRHLFQVSHS